MLSYASKRHKKEKISLHKHVILHENYLSL